MLNIYSYILSHNPETHEVLKATFFKRNKKIFVNDVKKINFNSLITEPQNKPDDFNELLNLKKLEITNSKGLTNNDGNNFYESKKSKYYYKKSNN